METLKSPVVAVVGNGPNLEIAQLDMLHKAGIYSVGMNRIYRAYTDTEWRPDAVFMSDFMRNKPEELGKDLKTHLEMGDYPVIIRGDLGRFLPHTLTNDERVSAFLDCPHSLAGPPDIDPRGSRSHLNTIEGCSFTTEEWHLPGYCKAGGSMAVSLQHAATRPGVRKIVLVGVLGEFYSDEAKNHLWPDYLPADADRTPEQAQLDTVNLYGMHQNASKETKKMGIEIVNCSPGSVIKAHREGELGIELMYDLELHPPLP